MSDTRIHSLDLIRGVAILGILLMNVMSMAGPDMSYYVPDWYGGAGFLEHGIYILQSLFVESRFMSLFSMLFGVGLVIQTDRFAARGLKPRRMIRRRLLWLLVFGLLHGFLIWGGDILTLYAISGFVVVNMTQWPVRRQIIVGVVFIFVGQLALAAALAGSVLTGKNLMEMPELPYTMAEIAALRGEWTGIGHFAENAAAYLELLAGIPLTLMWHAGGVMLLGMALYRSGFFTSATAWRRAVPVALTGFVLGAGVLWLRYRLGLDSSAAYSTMSLMMIPGILMAIGYAAILVRLAGEGTGRGAATPGGAATPESDAATPGAAWPLRRALENTGRMAFTLYLSQSVIVVGLTAGLAPGLWGSFGRGTLWAGVALLSVLQVMAAHRWHERRGQGPMEALWRRLAFGRAR